MTRREDIKDNIRLEIECLNTLQLEKTLNYIKQNFN